MAEAYSHLRPGGLMSVSFALPNLRMGFKIYSILSALRGAGAPVAVLTGYDTDKTYTFMVRKDGAVALPIAFMAAHDLVDRTSDFARGWPEKLDVPTDDWPFFYMDARMYPTSYVISLLLVLALEALVVRKLLPDQRWNRSLMPFFFLGAGFMLVETKAITELGLLFGNTWHDDAPRIEHEYLYAMCLLKSVPPKMGHLAQKLTLKVSIILLRFYGRRVRSLA